MVRFRVLAVIFCALVTACSGGSEPALKRATVPTAPLVATTQRPARPSTMATPTIAPSTTSTIPAPPSTIQDPEFDAIRAVMLGGELEYSNQKFNDAPDAQKLEQFFTKDMALRGAQKLAEDLAKGVVVRRGSVELMEVIEVKGTNLADLKIVTLCLKNDSKVIQVNDPLDSADDVVIDDELGVFAVDKYVSKGPNGWRIGTRTELEKARCDSVFP